MTQHTHWQIGSTIDNIRGFNFIPSASRLSQHGGDVTTQGAWKKTDKRVAPAHKCGDFISLRMWWGQCNDLLTQCSAVGKSTQSRLKDLPAVIWSSYNLALCSGLHWSNLMLWKGEEMLWLTAKFPGLLDESQLALTLTVSSDLQVRAAQTGIATCRWVTVCVLSLVVYQCPGLVTALQFNTNSNRGDNKHFETTARRYRQMFHFSISKWGEAVL